MANGNLFIQYSLSDTGTRPIPANTPYWFSPGCKLGPGSRPNDDDSTYTNGEARDIAVQIYGKSKMHYNSVSAEVWICNPSTITAPQFGLPVSSASGAPNYLTGAVGNVDVNAPGQPPLQFTIQGFVPYPGLVQVGTDHVCMFANCYGMPSDGPPDGAAFIGNPTPPPVDVVNDGHMAQRNLFAAPVGGMRKVFTFPFQATTPLLRGEEEVVLEIRQTPVGATLSREDVAFLHSGPYRDLTLHASEAPVKRAVLDRGKHGCGAHLKLGLKAHQPVELRLDVEFADTDTRGAVHGFDIVQRTAAGKVQGGLRVLSVATG
jgi:hypothetical protein